MKMNIEPNTSARVFFTFTASSQYFAGFDTNGIGWYDGGDKSVIDWTDVEDFMFDYIEGHLDPEDKEEYEDPTACNILLSEIDENTYMQLTQFYSNVVYTKQEKFELYMEQ